METCKLCKSELKDGTNFCSSCLESRLQISIKDSVVMGDIYQEYTQKSSPNFDQLIELLLSLNAQDRINQIQENEILLIQGFSDTFKVVGRRWSDLKNGRLERFFFEIFDSSLRNTVFAKTMYELSLEHNLKALQYLWHLTGVFTKDINNSIHPLLELVANVSGRPNHDAEKDFFDRWWWDGGDDEAVLKQVLTKINNLYEFHLLREKNGKYLVGFDDYVVCNLYTNENISESERKNLGDKLIKMLDEFNLYNIEDILAFTYGAYDGVLVSLIKTLIELSGDDGLFFNNEEYLNPLIAHIDSVNSWAKKHDNFSPFFETIITDDKDNILKILTHFKETYPTIPLISSKNSIIGSFNPI